MGTGSRNWAKAGRAYAEENPYCEYRLPHGMLCSRPGADVHHKIFRSQGGTHDPENLMTVCREHHSLLHGIGTV